MKFILTKASDWDYEKEIEINSLDELVEMVDEFGIILYKTKKGYEIKIYDSLIE